MNKRWLAVIALVALAVVPTSAAERAAPSASAASPGWVKTAKQRLGNLETKPAGSREGYQPRVKSFGPTWYNVDLNDCDMRNDILARDLTEVVFKSGPKCKAAAVASGTLQDPYTGQTIQFQSSSPLKVQIDHVVALAAAWRTGAKAWPFERRLFYANDPLVLLAVDGPANRVKSDGDAADWLPTNTSFRCRYVARQIAIKTKYELWVTQAERMAMSAVLGGC